MAKKVVRKQAKENNNAKISKDDEKVYAFLATFLSIIGFVIVIVTNKIKNDYINFYARQSLVVFIVGFFAGILSWVFSLFPIIGGVIRFALTAIVVIAWLISWVFAVSGEKSEVPVIGEYARKISL
jgi:uncharacterized membrane protein